MSDDIECLVCHRISFSWEHHRDCPECHWPIRPEELSGPIFGFDVAVAVRGTACSTMVVAKHFLASDEKTARRRAKNTRNFVSVLAVRPLTETQWITGYGDPKDKSKFS
jgi:hypothetical protein